MKFMTQEEKQLLLQDFCARLPYGVKIKTSRGIYIVDAVSSEGLFSIPNNDKTLNDLISLDGHYWLPITDDYKPFLRPMSSMTEEEIEIFNSDFGGIDNGYNSIEVKRIDWLIKNHFDYRGLIPMGLALPAPEDMYNF